MAAGGVQVTDDLRNFPGLTDREILAKTLWGEARGEGRVGMHAVANVILNRARKPGWWGTNIREVCLKRRQFSCWNPDDPNRKKMLAVTDEDPSYRVAVELADMAIQGVLEDITRGADHYHTKTIKPYWAKAEKPIAEWGNHLFYGEV